MMAILFGFVFILLALLGVTALWGSSRNQPRPDPSVLVAALAALALAAAVFGVSLRLALRDQDGRDED
jgi:hypothetical protein